MRENSKSLQHGSYDNIHGLQGVVCIVCLSISLSQSGIIQLKKEEPTSTRTTQKEVHYKNHGKSIESTCQQYHWASQGLETSSLSTGAYISSLSFFFLCTSLPFTSAIQLSLQGPWSVLFHNFGPHGSLYCPSANLNPCLLHISPSLLLHSSLTQKQ